MAEAVAKAFESGEHLAVQAGTGTGKSLAYLVPSIARALQTEQPVVVSTATIALQRQLVDRDLPRLVNSLADALPRKPTFALLKGRGNYLCLNKIHNGAAEDPNALPQDELFSPMAVSAMGRDVKRLTEWSSDTETGDRDELTPVCRTGRGLRSACRHASASGCRAASSEPTASRSARGRRPVPPTSSSPITHCWPSTRSPTSRCCPEYELLVVDEAHELADRVTAVATAELSATSMAVAHRRMSRLVDDELAQRFEAATATLSSMLHELDAGRIDVLDEELGTYLTALRDAANAARTAIDTAPSDPQAASARTEAVTALNDRQRHRHSDPHLVRAADPRPRRRGLGGAVRGIERRKHRTPRPGWSLLRVAPMSVSGLLRTRLFANTTAVLTSATLTLGGNFDAMARNWGLGGFADAGGPAKPGDAGETG